jgi:glucose/arabinose dehydrogenase
VFVPFENGRPSGPARDILTGFLSPDESVAYRRPVVVTIGPDRSVLMAGDVGNVIWCVTAAFWGSLAHALRRG